MSQQVGKGIYLVGAFDGEVLVDQQYGGFLQVHADEARLTLMLKNLVSNALRYSRPEDGTVAIAIDNNDRHWRIRVSDHGPGIPPDQAEFIGEPFYRGDPSRTRDTGGSGLGLYLARLVAVAHGGTLELDTSYTEGASLLVTLPRGRTRD